MTGCRYGEGVQGSLPTIDPPELIEQVRRLYVDEGLTQRQVAAKIGIGRMVVRRILTRNDIPMRSTYDYPDRLRGSNNGRWRTDNLRYDTLHARVYSVRGRPIGCTKCSQNDPDRRYEWANLTGDYENVQDYARMCVPCHRDFDAQRRAETGTNTSPYKDGGVKG
jgi:hypothetical protein